MNANEYEVELRILLAIIESRPEVPLEKIPDALKCALESIRCCAHEQPRGIE